jgi:hypothetical protein
LSKRPLFSSYSQGENRVTGSILAVFERLDFSTLERILRAATEESSLQLVRFDLVRPEGPGTVPDGRIAASFKYLFEVKTDYDSLRRAQLDGHLQHLNGGPYADKRLFVLTPDPEEPALITQLEDERVRWFNFNDLSRSIDSALTVEGVPDDERVLLRELQALFAQEGLLGREDTVVVAARNAYGFYLQHSAYVCQAGRAFRPGLTRLGFYRKRKIEREFPLILTRRDDVTFSSAEAARLRMTGDAHDAVIASLIESTVGGGSHIEGNPYQVFLLSAPDDDQHTLRLPVPIEHAGGAAWTMGQRYVYSERVKTSPPPKSTDELVTAASAPEEEI